MEKTCFFFKVGATNYVVVIFFKAIPRSMRELKHSVH